MKRSRPPKLVVVASITSLLALAGAALWLGVASKSTSLENQNRAEAQVEYLVQLALLAHSGDTAYVSLEGGREVETRNSYKHGNVVREPDTRKVLVKAPLKERVLCRVRVGALDLSAEVPVSRAKGEHYGKPMIYVWIYYDGDAERYVFGEATGGIL